jgi:hypothetical protein
MYILSFRNERIGWDLQKSINIDKEKEGKDLYQQQP